MPIRNLTNLTQSSLVIQDLKGVTLAAGEIIDGNLFGEQYLRDSVNVIEYLVQGKLKLDDGANEYLGAQAVDVIRGTTSQVTRDGKQILTMSDRPKDFYRCYTGRGDDVDSTPKKIGMGPSIHLIADAGLTVTLGVKFVDDVYIRDGEISYLNAGFDSHLTMDVICPAGIPFPSPTKTGTLDLVNGSFVPNLTNTGAYMTAPVEVTLFRFINAMHLIGDDRNPVNSPEPFMLFHPYFIRFSMTADSTIQGQLKAAATMGMFRKKTV